MSKRYCCDWCYGAIEHRDFRNGAVDEKDFEEVDYTPRKRKNNKACKKSKTGEPCEFTVAIILRSWYSKVDERWHHQRQMTCKRCGKHGWGRGMWTSFSTLNKI